MKGDSFHPVLPLLFGFRFNISKRGIFASLDIVGVVTEAPEKGVVMFLVCS